MKKQFCVILAVLLAVAGMLSACGAPDAGIETDSTAQILPADSGDGIIVYAGNTIFDESLDPVKGAMSYGYSFTNCALLKVAPDSSYVGDMAESWEISDNALEYTFKLRSGLKFSDGSPLTAEDVVFTYDTVKQGQANNANVDLTRLAAVSAIDALTVRMTLSEPYSPFLDTTAMLGIVPSDAYDGAKFDQMPIGSGPWKVIQYDPNQQIIVIPNENYYEGAPLLPKVTLVAMAQDAALAAAKSGQLDVVMISPDYADQKVEGMTLHSLETMDIRNVSLPVEPGHTQGGELVGNDVTSDLNVRKALNIGLSRERIIANALNGIGKPAQSFTSNLPWAEPVPVNDANAAEAAKLLESAGWTDTDGDGIREKDGLRCAFDLYAAEDRYALAAAIAENAKQLGIEIIPHSSSWDEIGENRTTAAVVWGWGQYSPTVLYSLFDSALAFGEFDNVVGYSNPAVDALIDKAFAETSQDAAIADWKEVQKIANADIPYLYIANIEHCYFINDGLDISQATQIPHPHGHGIPIICNLKDWKLK